MCVLISSISINQSSIMSSMFRVGYSARVWRFRAVRQAWLKNSYTLPQQVGWKTGRRAWSGGWWWSVVRGKRKEETLLTPALPLSSLTCPTSSIYAYNKRGDSGGSGIVEGSQGNRLSCGDVLLVSVVMKADIGRHGHGGQKKEEGAYSHKVASRLYLPASLSLTG